MKRTSYLYLLLSGWLITACSVESSLEAKKEELMQLETKRAQLNQQIRDLEKEITALDSNALRANNLLVTVMVPGTTLFVKNLEFRAQVESDRNVTVSAEAMGRIVSLPVTEGRKVGTGQLLAAIDASTIQSNLKQVESQLELATSVFERRKNLWDQKIGTEVQYLEAKSNKESLESQRNALASQLRQTRVQSPFSGTVDAVFVKSGEMVQPGVPIARVVSPTDMYLKADVSEAHLGKFTPGDEVEVSLIGEDQLYKTRVKSVGNVVNPQNRTFQLEVALPAGQRDFKFRPNQVATITLADYVAKEAIQIPNKVILTGKDSKFVYVVKEVEGQPVAIKKVIELGETSEGMTEILKGLDPLDQVITRGYREVSDGTVVQIHGNATEIAQKQ